MSMSEQLLSYTYLLCMYLLHAIRQFALNKPMYYQALYIKLINSPIRIFYYKPIFTSQFAWEQFSLILSKSCCALLLGQSNTQKVVWNGFKGAEIHFHHLLLPSFHFILYRYEVHSLLVASAF